MPLSEEELRLLDQMERALVAEDPKLASTMRGTAAAAAGRKRAVVAGVVFVLGVVVMMTGAIGQMAWLGVVGFVVMVASATYGLAALRGGGSDHAPSTEPRQSGRAGFGVVDGGKSSRRPRRSPRPKTQGSFTERMEERWRRRRESGDF